MKFLYRVAGAVPLAAYKPFRLGVVSRRRGSLLRGLCVLVVKLGARAYRGRLATLLAEIRPLDASDVVFRAADSMVMDAVYWVGIQGYEGKVAEVWTTLCRDARAVVEIGGNVGLFTVLGARATRGKYTVVEPLPANVEILRENLARNGLSRVDVREAASIPACGSTDVMLNVPDERRGAPVGAYLAEGVELPERANAAQICVTGLPFRDLISGCDVIKIDAEGSEAALLESAREIIITEHPALLVEVLPSATRLAALLADLVRRAHYTIQIIPEWGADALITVPPGEFDALVPERFHSKDVLLSGEPLVLPTHRGL